MSYSVSSGFMSVTIIGMTRVHTKLAGPMFSIKSADLNRTAFSATKTSTPMYQNRWSLAYCIPANRRKFKHRSSCQIMIMLIAIRRYSEGRVVLYSSATFFSRSPIDCIHFTKDVPRRSWPQNLDFDCTFRPELEPSVPLIDLLYWVVDDFRAAKIKIWLADTYYRTDRVGDKAQQKTIEALKHFLSYSKSDTTFILPSCFEPSVKNLKNGSSGKVTFKFLEDNTSDKNI